MSGRVDADRRSRKHVLDRDGYPELGPHRGHGSSKHTPLGTAASSLHAGARNNVSPSICNTFVLSCRLSSLHCHFFLSFTPVTLPALKPYGTFFALD
jgi:hypothetical protein